MHSQHIDRKRARRPLITRKGLATTSPQGSKSDHPHKFSGNFSILGIVEGSTMLQLSGS